MRIISKFKDYYDSAQGMGIDETLVYVRHPRKINLSESDNNLIKELRKDAPGYKRRWDDELSSYAIIIGFCGKLYPCMELVRTIGTRGQEDILENTYVYSYKELVDYLTKNKLKKSLKDITEKDVIWGNNIISAQRFFKLGEQSSRLEHIFINNQTPVFAIVGQKEIEVGRAAGVSGMSHPITEKDGLIINPNLKDLNFCRIVDSFTAFQEIAMYVGGVIPKDGPDMVDISNDMMIAKKGFNDASFRKMPDTRKRKQKKGKIKK